MHWFYHKFKVIMQLLASSIGSPAHPQATVQPIKQIG